MIVFHIFALPTGKVWPPDWECWYQSRTRRAGWAWLSLTCPSLRRWQEEETPECDTSSSDQRAKLPLPSQSWRRTALSHGRLDGRHDAHSGFATAVQCLSSSCLCCSPKLCDTVSLSPYFQGEQEDRVEVCRSEEELNPSYQYLYQVRSTTHFS